MLGRQRRHHKAMQKIIANTKENKNPFADVNFPRRPARCKIKVNFANEKHRAISAVENCLYDAFLILNIAAPGSCSFFGASLTGHFYEPSISLSNTNFELALLTARNKFWPPIRMLSLETVLRWFKTVRNSGHQIPQNPMERVFFALWHIAKGDMSQVDVIWLFYAFESLLQTHVGENFSSLVRRFSLLLEPKEREVKLLKTGLRKLYDIRNAIVHGGFEIAHPMHDEYLDPRVNQNFNRLSEATDFGNALLLAAIHKCIVMGWPYPSFEETLRSK